MNIEQLTTKNEPMRPNLAVLDQSKAFILVFSSATCDIKSPEAIRRPKIGVINRQEFNRQFWLVYFYLFELFELAWDTCSKHLNNFPMF